jgi:hypothetical protein
VLQHPTGYDGGRADQTSDCTGCHADYHNFPYGYYYSPYPSFWWDHQNYGHYYAYPWWWSYYDYGHHNGGAEPPADDEGSSADRGTKFDRRTTRGEPLAPPYHQSSGGSWPGQPGIYDLGGGGTSGSGGAVTPSRPTTGGGDTTRTKEEGDSHEVKEVRQSTQSTTPPPATSEPAKPKDRPKDDQGKKKPRR